MDIKTSKIMAHRGLWIPPNKGNSIPEIIAGYSSGFGVELDIRDFHGKIAIAHDPIESDPVFLFDLLVSLNQDFPFESKPMIALNVKSDGLLDLFSEDEIQMLSSLNHFFFDMSVPESVKYTDRNKICATRVSELEPLHNHGTNSRNQINWIDGFYESWWEKLIPENIFGEKTKTCILVSPEIHGRKHIKTWEWAKRGVAKGFDIKLCTDYPLEALEFLND